MIYPPNSTEKIGFEEIKNLIKKYCLSNMGIEMVERIRVMTQFETINLFLKQTLEFQQTLVSGTPLHINSFHNLKPFIPKIKIEGSFLTEEEFSHILLSFTTLFQVLNYFSERATQYPHLEILFQHLHFDKKLISLIETVVDEKANIKSNASALLQEINHKILQKEAEVRKKIDFIFKQVQQNGWNADGNMTIKDGRLCIPILSENKRKLKGYIHDESASGQTVYIEPEEVFNLNNQLRDLEFEKRREIIRILTELTTQVRPFLSQIIDCQELLTKFDFIRAKALFSIKIEATMPTLLRESTIKLRNARHPLLLLNNQKDGKTTVPLNAQIDTNSRILVVSGPNAGGKSVCMKTIALLQMMLQAGLLIPVAEDSQIGIFRQFLTDIGDEQSIESDLSTYSAHLSKMKYFVEHADAKTLVFIDEFGGGTDPQFGGPIAEAVLEQLNEKKVKGVITTHYSNLKIFASHTEGLENASMMFDNIAMQPLYILETGKPGSSYAFEIAQKIGLSNSVLQAARKKIGYQQKKVDELLVDLEREKREILTTKTNTVKDQSKLQQLINDNEQLNNFLEDSKKAILKDAKKQAQEIIKNANKLIENTIAQIKESKANKEITQQLRRNLETEIVKHQSKETISTIAIQDVTPLVKGDWVQLIDSNTIGQVIDIAKQQVILAIGDLRTVVKIQKVQKIAHKEVKKQLKNVATHLTETTVNFSGEIDVRGMRVQEAIFEIEKRFDKALMLGIHQLKIIHGKGNGILRKTIRDYFKKYDQISRIENEHPDRGGDGISYFYFR